MRKVAIENSVDLREVKGTGKGGRILKEDVLNFVDSVRPNVFDVVSNDVVRIKSPEGRKVHSTPAVRHKAKEEGIDLGKVQGTGENGRVLMDDLLKHIKGTTQGNSISCVLEGVWWTVKPLV